MTVILTRSLLILTIAMNSIFLQQEWRHEAKRGMWPILWTKINRLYKDVLIRKSDTHNQKCRVLGNMLTYREELSSPLNPFSKSPNHNLKQLQETKSLIHQRMFKW